MNQILPLTTTTLESMPVRKSVLAPESTTPEILIDDRRRDLASRHVVGSAAWFCCVHEVFLQRVRQSAEWPMILDTLDADLSTDETLQEVFDRDYANAKSWTREEMWAFVFVIRLADDNPALAIGRSVFGFSETAKLNFDRALDRGIQWLGSARADSSFWIQLQGIIAEDPHEIDDQVHEILRHFGETICADTERAALTAADILREHRPRGGGGPGPVRGPLNPETDREGEHFSEDRAWMGGVVCIAKLAHVWMAQLAVQYDRAVDSLDEIPDEALDELADHGINALWIIGIWQRSRASAKIKVLAGQSGALASAYAVDAYRVADDLGGEDAYASLKTRASSRGIRLAVDMVPNHMGIDSRWLLENPDDFLQRSETPNARYRFSGPDLCEEETTSIHLEDGYWDRTDAAVVFRYHDQRSQMTRYIYHGNDGTSMPWNDTAQLDYSQASVREKVIDQIVEMARRASIIRFDAAMTLVTQHIRRLWFPRPGQAGAIYSRAQSDLDDAAFDARIPGEFWRDVVDALSERCPDTLLVAEAFWMMEGYFVKTLGMHRVYNSAFMNLMAAEDNEKHQEILTEVLEYSPSVLARFVNYMSNPDEDSAVELFGKADKYFGVATLLATLPGTPLLAHGQIEGLQEKYGMEFRAAQNVEPIDAGLIEEHRRKIFPLFQDRKLYAGIERFWLYPFRTTQGIDSDVYAFSNSMDNQRVLVIYNNSAETKQGSISDSYAKNQGTTDQPDLKTVHWSEALDVSDHQGLLCLLEARLQQEFVCDLKDAQKEGLTLSLGPYESLVFREFYAPSTDVAPRMALARTEAAQQKGLNPLIAWIDAGCSYDK